ncbi:MAG: UDP-N-acetylmuramoyl-L-alanine--D-glutamate ligase [Caulobacteraceae bacterium]
MIPVRGFAGRRIAVLGLARSGLVAAQALAAGGARVLAWDDDQTVRARAEALGMELADPMCADLADLTALVLSPGIPTSLPAPHPAAARARASGVEIIGDVELFAREVALAPPHLRPKIVAITGTNGKSTTAALITHVLAEAGRDVRLGGNIGVGVLDLEPMHGGAVYVLELSSYQLELTSSLKADAAVLLNISPDHLERHGDMAGYLAAKRRVLLNQGKGDAAVIGVDDAWCQQICTEITAANRRTVVPISAGKTVSRGVYALGGRLYDASEGASIEVADLSRARSLMGRHNWQNAAAAWAAVRALDLPARDAAAGLMSFPGLAHRMETVGFLGEVRFVNDSKATNADAARQAMGAWPRFYWIAGGRPKAGGIDSLSDLFGRVIKAYLIGEAATDFARALQGEAPAQICGDIASAAREAFADARRAGEEAVVLFSPACASFDQFSDFEARGEAFRHAVHALTGADLSEARA